LLEAIYSNHKPKKNAVLLTPLSRSLLDSGVEVGYILLMPSKNSVKIFDENQVWHVYNRGNDKRVIFHDERDYSTFLSYIKFALLPEIDEETKTAAFIQLKTERIRRLKLYKEVELISYCLMPNHFHLQLYQSSVDGISKFMRSVMTGYVAYYNYRYKKSGRLFQGVYKGSQINSDAYFIHLSRYIHLNPADIGDYKSYEYSSYKHYTDQVETPLWLTPKSAIQGMSASEYEKYCDEYMSYRAELKKLNEIFADY